MDTRLVSLSAGDLGGEQADWPADVTEQTIERDGRKYLYRLAEDDQAVFAGMVK